MELPGFVHGTKNDTTVSKVAAKANGRGKQDAGDESDLSIHDSYTSSSWEQPEQRDSVPSSPSADDRDSVGLERRSSADSFLRKAGIKHRRQSSFTLMNAMNDQSALNFFMYSGSSAWPILNPLSVWYKAWLNLTIVATIYIAFITPGRIAFERSGLDGSGSIQLSSIDLVELAIDFTFMVDIIINFRLAYFSHGNMVTSGRAIAISYLSSTFVVDLLGTIPFDIIFAGLVQGKVGLVVLKLLGLLRLVRMKRLKHTLESMEADFRYDYVMVSLTKFFTILCLAGHWWGCGIYFIASVQDFGQDTWVYMYADSLPQSPISRQYATSVYWAFTTLTTVGFGDISPVSTYERYFAIVIMVVNLGISAYIVGNMTIMATRQHSVTSEYRTNMNELYTFMQSKNVPDEMMKNAMAQAQLTFDMHKLGDDPMKHCPPYIRKQMIKFLYKSSLSEAYLFKGCSELFVNQVTSHAKEAYFLPGTVIINAGDQAEAFYYILDGQVQVWHDGVLLRTLGRGQMCGEEGVICDFQQPWDIRTAKLCRMLQVARADWVPLAEKLHKDAAVTCTNILHWVEEELVQGTKFKKDPLAQELVELIQMGISKNVRNKVIALCYSAAGGEVNEVRRKIAECHPNSVDYYGRTALHIAAAHGHEQVVELLLKKGADPNIQDKSDTTPLAEAALRQHHKAVAALRRAGARLELPDPGGVLCKCAFDSDAKLLTVLLDCGADPNAADYDGRTALHLSCAEGLRTIGQILLDRGADPNCEDRWGHTPLSEAKAAGQRLVVEMLIARGAQEGQLKAVPSVLERELSGVAVQRMRDEFAVVEEELRNGEGGGGAGAGAGGGGEPPRSGDGAVMAAVAQAVGDPEDASAVVDAELAAAPAPAAP